ncbi:unnamed protein product [Nesidiocoris tenuis]|uniref:Complexin n=1 Tax=Nesidiocoris tenuis TaxID=355587 RepID=A0A6H5G0Y1_9HEMI|nr:unnamed protein product [Nesidiocoris tenuis]
MSLSSVVSLTSSLIMSWSFCFIVGLTSISMINFNFCFIVFLVLSWGQDLQLKSRATLESRAMDRGSRTAVNPATDGLAFLRLPTAQRPMAVLVIDGHDQKVPEQGAVGGDNDGDEGDKEKEEEAERERQEAIREAEERRKEKHRKMEEEREKMRQEIRDKYNIKKKEELPEPQQEEPANPLMRKKKTPEELAREAEEAEQDDFTKLKNTIETQVNEIKTQIESKCSLQ